MKQFIKKIGKKIKRESENGSRKNVMEELFYDFNRSRVEVYKMNFFRGIFFGVGSAIGATILLALILGFLNMFTDLPGGIGNFIERIIETMNQTPSR